MRVADYSQQTILVTRLFRVLMSASIVELILFFVLCASFVYMVLRVRSASRGDGGKKGELSAISVIFALILFFCLVWMDLFTGYYGQSIIPLLFIILGFYYFSQRKRIATHYDSPPSWFTAILPSALLLFLPISMLNGGLIGDFFGRFLGIFYEWNLYVFWYCFILASAFIIWSKVLKHKWNLFNHRPDITSLQACYRCLIPVYNLYWIHVVNSGWTKALNNHIDSLSSTESLPDKPMKRASLFRSVVLTVLIGWFILSCIYPILLSSLINSEEEMCRFAESFVSPCDPILLLDSGMFEFQLLIITLMAIIGALESIRNREILLDLKEKGLLPLKDDEINYSHSNHATLRYSITIILLSTIFTAFQITYWLGEGFGNLWHGIYNGWWAGYPTGYVFSIAIVLYFVFWNKMVQYRWRILPPHRKGLSGRISGFLILLPLVQLYWIQVVTVQWRQSIREWMDARHDISMQTPIRLGPAWTLSVLFCLYTVLLAYSIMLSYFHVGETPFTLWYYAIWELYLYGGILSFTLILPAALLIVGWIESVQAERLMGEIIALGLVENEDETSADELPGQVVEELETEVEPEPESKPETVPSMPESEWRETLDSEVVEKPVVTETGVFGSLSNKVRIGSGGMAEIFLADQISAGRKIIIKQAYEEHVPLRIAVLRLKSEGELMRSFSHYRVPTFIAEEEFTREDGRPSYRILMEYIEGGDLKETMSHINKVGLQLPIDKIINYLQEICEPLVHLASLPEPIYHRDLKPQNVIIHPKRGPVVIDWGLAKLVQAGTDVSVTRGGSGTWTAPERDSGVNGPFTDAYSLGKILYYLATGEQPPVIMSYAERDKMIAVGHPQWLADLMLKAAWPRHEERLQNVHMFTSALANEGRFKQPSQSEAAADEFTTWG